MPVGYAKRYYREDARRNPEWLYVFGDNVVRRGRKGQALEMRGEPNAVGVCTKYYPGIDPDDYFGEEPAQVIAQKRSIDNDMKRLFIHVKNGGVVIWPSDGIGTKLAKLPERAPSTFAYIEQKLAALIRVGKLFDRGECDAANWEAQGHV